MDIDPNEQLLAKTRQEVMSMLWRFEETLKTTCLSRLILLLDFFKSYSGICLLISVLLDTRDVNLDNPPNFQEEISFWGYIFRLYIYMYILFPGTRLSETSRPI